MLLLLYLEKRFNLYKIPIAILYVSVMIYIVFLLPRRQELTSQTQYVYIHLTPLKNTIDSFKSLKGHSLESKVKFFILNFFGNIFLFLPLPVLLMEVSKLSSPKKIIGIGALISILIECIQYFWRIGIPDIDDVLLNITGVAAGLIAWRFLIKKKKESRTIEIGKYK